MTLIGLQGLGAIPPSIRTIPPSIIPPSIRAIPPSIRPTNGYHRVVRGPGYVHGAGPLGQGGMPVIPYPGFGAAAPYDFGMLLEASPQGYKRVIPAQQPLVVGAASNNWRLDWSAPAATAGVVASSYEPSNQSLKPVLDTALEQRWWILMNGDPFGAACADASKRNPCWLFVATGDTHDATWQAMKDGITAAVVGTDYDAKALIDKTYVLAEGQGAGPSGGIPSNRKLVAVAATVAGVGLAAAVGWWLVKGRKR